MRNALLVLLSLTLVTVAGTAMAEKKDKKQILHCGCVVLENPVADENGDFINDMQYVALDINGNSKGHAWNHVSGSEDECWDGEEGELVDEVFVPETETFTRTGDDCRLAGPNDPFLDDCDGPVAGDSCGFLLD